MYILYLKINNNKNKSKPDQENSMIQLVKRVCEHLSSILYITDVLETFSFLSQHWRLCC